MEKKLSTKLADHALYEDARVGELEVWNKKYAELRDAMSKAEALWMTALEKLEAAERSNAA
jgi:ATP-binding cassette subfamily F protein 3